MSRRVAFPFLTLTDASISVSGWQISLDRNSWNPAGDFLSEWDYTTEVHLHQKVTFDFQSASNELEIPVDQLRLAVRTRIGTGPGRLPRQIITDTENLFDSKSPEIIVEHQVDSSRLSTVVDLLLEVVLPEEMASSNRLAPQQGDRVWFERIRIRLEGEESRFPIQIVNLRELLGAMTASSAPWYLHWSRDWSRDLHGAFQLFINEESKETVERVKAQDPTTLQTIMGATISQVCEAFVRDQDVHSTIAHQEPGSLGEQAESWLEQAWPGKPMQFVQTILENRPGLFHATLLALAEIPERL